MSIDLTIKALPSDKDQISQPDLCKQGVLPPLGSSMIFCGATGSGKSNLCGTLLTDKRFFKECFNAVYLFSPTAKFDAMQGNFGIPKQRIVDNPDRDGQKGLKMIMDAQAEMIKKKGAGKCPQICIIFDDIIGCKKFLRTEEFTKAFIGSRHYCVTSMLLTQAWTQCPRTCRLQATAIFYWRGSQSEQELLAQEYAPPNFSKKKFLAMVSWATEEPYQFLCINKNQPMKDRFRKGLEEIINIQ